MLCCPLEGVVRVFYLLLLMTDTSGLIIDHFLVHFRCDSIEPRPSICGRGGSFEKEVTNLSLLKMRNQTRTMKLVASFLLLINLVMPSVVGAQHAILVIFAQLIFFSEKRLFCFNPILLRLDRFCSSWVTKMGHY